MKIIKINDTKYFIPESYDDILLEDFENWFDYNPETTEDKIRLVSMICKIPFDILLELPTTVYTIIVDTGKSSVSCPLKPSDSTPLKHSTMPP